MLQTETTNTEVTEGNISNEIKEISLNDIKELKKKMKKYSKTWVDDMVRHWNDQYKDEEIGVDKIYNIVNNRVTHQKYRIRFVFVAAIIIESVAATQNSAGNTLKQIL